MTFLCCFLSSLFSYTPVNFGVFIFSFYSHTPASPHERIKEISTDAVCIRQDSMKINDKKEKHLRLIFSCANYLAKASSYDWQLILAPLALAHSFFLLYISFMLFANFPKCLFLVCPVRTYSTTLTSDWFLALHLE